ncbi:gamma-glutamylcyclotransferase family protein [Wenyingzhuangia sp. 1_MG-2023]|nr:gamma-glutamylcyclotransferase family protein [Wenyingzhuangia sp. 1_MG-2023]
MQKVFTYGTLQNKEIQMELFGRILTGKSDQLIGFKKEIIILGTNSYPILKLGDETSIIDGICYEMTNEDLKICDIYEGKEYQRILITLASKQKAWVYIEA